MDPQVKNDLTEPFLRNDSAIGRSSAARGIESSVFNQEMSKTQFIAKELVSNSHVKSSETSKRNIELHLDDITHTCRLNGK